MTAALRSCRKAFLAVGAFSGAINLLMLSGSLYMLQIYDRVLTSRSVETLIAISLLLLLAYAIQGMLDSIRVKMLARIGARFDEQLAPLAFAATQRLPLAGLSAERAMQPIRDLDQIRGFLSSLGPTALFDMPWMPLFFAACFLLHPWLGWLAVAGGSVILLLTVVTEFLSRRATKALTGTQAARHTLAETSRRNADSMTAMGMTETFGNKWKTLNGDRKSVV